MIENKEIHNSLLKLDEMKSKLKLISDLQIKIDENIKLLNSATRMQDKIKVKHSLALLILNNSLLIAFVLNSFVFSFVFFFFGSSSDMMVNLFLGFNYICLSSLYANGFIIAAVSHFSEKLNSDLNTLNGHLKLIENSIRDIQLVLNNTCN